MRRSQLCEEQVRRDFQTEKQYEQWYEQERGTFTELKISLVARDIELQKMVKIIMAEVCLFHPHNLSGGLLLSPHFTYKETES